MTTHLAIITTPRKTETVVDSLISLRDSDFTGTIDVVEDVPPRLGAFRNYHRALLRAIDSGADIVGVLPDDYLYAPNWHYVVSGKMQEAGIGYCNIYVPRGVGDRYRFKRGWNKCNKGWAGTWGTGYLFPLEVAKQIVNHPFYLAHLNGELSGEGLANYEFNKRIDHCIPEVVNQLGFDQWYFAPSLTEHIGKTSTLGHKHTRAENGYLR